MYNFVTGYQQIESDHTLCREKPIVNRNSQGKPVISTRWNSIPEIVNDKLGFLIEPKNHIELKNAITSFNRNNYQDYSRNALLQFDKFNSDIVNKNILKDIYNLK